MGPVDTPEAATAAVQVSTASAWAAQVRHALPPSIRLTRDQNRGAVVVFFFCFLSLCLCLSLQVCWTSWRWGSSVHQRRARRLRLTVRAARVSPGPWLRQCRPTWNPGSGAQQRLLQAAAAAAAVCRTWQQQRRQRRRCCTRTSISNSSTRRSSTCCSLCRRWWRTPAARLGAAVQQEWDMLHNSSRRAGPPSLVWCLTLCPCRLAPGCA